MGKVLVTVVAADGAVEEKQKSVSSMNRKNRIEGDSDDDE